MRKTIAVLALMLMCVAVWAKEYALINPTYQMPRSGAMSKTELMGANSTFTDSTKWVWGEGWYHTLEAGKAVSVSSSGGFVYGTGQAISMTVGKTYRITFEWTRTSGDIVLKTGVGNTIATITTGSSGRTTADFVADSAAAIQPFYFTGSWSGSITNITVREILP